jgi:hypothetical protein
MATLGPFDFRGGYSPGYEFTTLPPGRSYSTVMENCRYTNGYVTPRWGQSNVVGNAGSTLSGGTQINGLTVWQDTVNAKTALVTTVNAKLWIADATTYLAGGAGITFTDRTGAVTISANTFGTYTFDSLNNILILAGNSAAPVAPIKVTAYNANAAALGGNPPNADCVKQCNNFLFLGRDLSSTANQSLLYWSNVNDPETWTVTNKLYISKNDGEPIMALGAIGPVLYIFKQTSIWSLNATTITVSGAVTLGPLQQVIKGVGCCGPLALDNLPNGNIVFIGTNGHFYEFDGSSVLDRSRQAYPGPNFYENGTYYINDNWTFGIGAGNADTKVAVKFWPGMNEVWIAFNTCQNNLGQICFMYDYERGICQGIGNTSNGSGLQGCITASCFATIPSPLLNVAFAWESSNLFFYGSGNGQVMCMGNPTKPYPTDNQVTPVAQNFSVGTIIQFAKEASDFIPRSLIFETTQTQSANAKLSSLSVYADYDVYKPETTDTAKRIYNSSGQLPTRVRVNIPQRQDTATTVTVQPTFLSLLWVGKGTGTASSQSCIFRLGKFYLSDEIML